jgi:hypothetical protein
MTSLEDQVRAHLDIARGLSDASLKVQTGHQDDIDVGEVLALLLATTTALMDCAVDSARAIDQLAQHTSYEPPDEER